MKNKVDVMLLVVFAFLSLTAVAMDRLFPIVVSKCELAGPPLSALELCGMLNPANEERKFENLAKKREIEVENFGIALRAFLEIQLRIEQQYIAQTKKTAGESEAVESLELSKIIDELIRDEIDYSRQRKRFDQHTELIRGMRHEVICMGAVFGFSSAEKFIDQTIDKITSENKSFWVGFTDTRDDFVFQKQWLDGYLDSKASFEAMRERLMEVLEHRRWTTSVRAYSFLFHLVGLMFHSSQELAFWEFCQKDQRFAEKAVQLALEQCFSSFEVSEDEEDAFAHFKYAVGTPRTVFLDLIFLLTKPEKYRVVMARLLDMHRGKFRLDADETVEEVIDGIIQEQRRKMERGRRLLKKEIPPSQSLDLLPEESYLQRYGLKWRLR
ncbi:MAG: hypothetical protein IJJ33_10470 [Victivallales bacterium]|nr:hypothetical protein [Victivallales bacterium]